MIPITNLDLDLLYSINNLYIPLIGMKGEDNLKKSLSNLKYILYYTLGRN